MEWLGLRDVLVRSLLAYVLLLVFIRVSGNRTLAKLRAFDLVVTIALGGLLAAAITDQDTPLWVSLVGMGSLILLQWAVAFVGVRSRRFNRLVTNESILLYQDGAYDPRAMRRARVTRDEVEAAARSAGHAGLHTVGSAWLEVNGSVSIVPREKSGAVPVEEP